MARWGRGGRGDFRDFIVGVTVRKEVDEATGMEDIAVLEHRDKIHPQVLVRGPADRKNILAYIIPVGAKGSEQGQ